MQQGDLVGALAQVVKDISICIRKLTSLAAWWPHKGAGGYGWGDEGDMLPFWLSGLIFVIYVA